MLDEGLAVAFLPVLGGQGRSTSTVPTPRPQSLHFVRNTTMILETILGLSALCKSGMVRGCWHTTHSASYGS